MAGTARPPLRAQIVILIVAALVAGVGAVVWSRTIAADEDPVAEEDDVRLFDPDAVVDPDSSNPPNDGEEFPVVQVASADGEIITLEPDGRPMVVNLWWSGCGPCARELQAFSDVDAEYAGDVRFVGVNPHDDAEKMLEFAANRGVGYELYLDEGYELLDATGLVYFPMTLFVSADGRIVAQTGEVSESELREQVAAIAVT